MEVHDLHGPRSLVRLIGLFSVLSDRGESGLSLASLGQELHTPKSSLLNLLRPLVAGQLLLHDNGNYKLGPAMYRSAASWMAAWRFPQVVRPFMERLAESSGETVLLGVLNPESEVLTYVEVIDGPRPVRFEIAPGTTRPLHGSATGRLLLAFGEAQWRDAYLGSLEFRRRLTRREDRDALALELKQIQQQGLSVSIDRYLPGLSAIAAPLLDGDGRCLASLGIAGATGRFVAERESLCALVKEMASRASGLPAHDPTETFE